MPRSLDQHTRPYLERRGKDVKDTDCIGQRIQKMLEADKERRAVIAKCDHTPSSSTSKKTCCGRCRAFFLPGMGEQWTVDQKQADEYSSVFLWSFRHESPQFPSPGFIGHPEPYWYTIGT